MRSPRYPMPTYLIASVLALALSSCGNPVRPEVQHPPVADLTPAAEPQLDPAAVATDSAAALDAYDIAHESWGRLEHGKLVRACWWFKDLGAAGLDCGARPPIAPAGAP